MEEQKRLALAMDLVIIIHSLDFHMTVFFAADAFSVFIVVVPSAA